MHVPTQKNIDWLLDLLFDSRIAGIPISGKNFFSSNFPLGMKNSNTRVESSAIHNHIINIFQIILRQKDPISINCGTRKSRRLSIVRQNGLLVTRNLFQLSTGETQLINIFLSIIRDYDLSEGSMKSLSHIKGIVIIDEIDLHLNVVHQEEILPKLITMFPNVQFIITTHSPLFLIGMEKELGKDGFEIINLPDGERLAADDFSEFKAAYASFRETKRYREEVRKEIDKSSKPIVFVEGNYDIRYIKRAAVLLDKSDLLNEIQLKDGDGCNNLDKAAKSITGLTSEAISNKVLFLYDCDTKKKDKKHEKIHIRIIPEMPENPIEKGIENLFPEKTIEKLDNTCPKFIDHEGGGTKKVRGKEQPIPITKSVNKNEKGNMCNWLCQNGTKQWCGQF